MDFHADAPVKQPSRYRPQFRGGGLMIMALGVLTASHAMWAESRATSLTGILDVSGVVLAVAGTIDWFRR